MFPTSSGAKIKVICKSSRFYSVFPLCRPHFLLHVVEMSNFAPKDLDVRCSRIEVYSNKFMIRAF